MNLISVRSCPVNSSGVAVLGSSLLVGEGSIGFQFTLSSLLWAWLGSLCHSRYRCIGFSRVL